MAPPHDGNEYLPFAAMIELEKINTVTFRSRKMPFSGAGRAYGGHVYAQAVWAAAHTVNENFVVHSVTGYFILAGLADVPFVYTVKTIRDGKSYCTRVVNVTQAEGKGICFTCTCSFKAPEDSPLDAQETIDIWDKYRVVLDGSKETDWEEAPAMDFPWYWEKRRKTGHNEPFPGLESRKVDMTAYNKSLSPFDRRQLLFYRAIGSLPSNANMHACAHLYSSDRNSLFIVANHFDIGNNFSHMASLSHTVVFHTPASDILLTSNDGSRKWFTQEVWTSRIGAGRAMHHSRMIGADGKHVASSMQEGVLRLGKL